MPEYAARGAGSLHASGVSVTMGVMRDECERLISGYATLANSKIHRMARRHMQRFGRVSSFFFSSFGQNKTRTKVVAGGRGSGVGAAKRGVDR